MNAQQTFELMKCINPEHGAEIAEKVIPVLFEKSTCGVACHLFACVYCGIEFVIFHVIPIKIPVECPSCRKMQGYIKEELR